MVVSWPYLMYLCAIPSTVPFLADTVYNKSMSAIHLSSQRSRVRFSPPGVPHDLGFYLYGKLFLSA